MSFPFLNEVILSHSTWARQTRYLCCYGSLIRLYNAYPGLEVHYFLKSLNKVLKSFLTCALIDTRRAGTIYKDTQWERLRTFAKNKKKEFNADKQSFIDSVVTRRESQRLT